MCSSQRGRGIQRNLRVKNVDLVCCYIAFQDEISSEKSFNSLPTRI